MSFLLVKLIIEGRGARTPGELAVLVALANRLNEQTGACFPSLATIAREARVTTRGADGILRALEQRGLVTITGRGRSRSYQLHEAKLESEATSESEASSKTEPTSETEATSGTRFRASERRSKKSERSSVEQIREQRIQQGKNRAHAQPYSQWELLFSRVGISKSMGKQWFLDNRCDLVDDNLVLVPDRELLTLLQRHHEDAIAAGHIRLELAPQRATA